MADEIKHNGCADCGDKTTPMLYSITRPLINPATQKSVSPNKAVCEACLKHYVL